MLERKISIAERLREKILILDGAMGTRIQQAGLTPEDFGGDDYDGCNEILNLTRPDVIRRIHEDYLEAGADVIETNTFGATRIVLAEYGLQEKTMEINRLAAVIAAEEARKYATPEWPRYVAGALGPTTKTLSVTGGTTFDELVESYHEQTLGLLAGGVDLLLLETSQDTLNVKAAGIGIRQAFEETNQTLPIWVSGTIEPMGTMLAGQNVESFYLSIRHLNPLIVGLNCATGPEFMRDHLRTLSSLADCGVSCYPNAGLPDEDGNYHETPQGLAQKIVSFADQGWLNIAGGCCGTTPEHIRALAQALKDKKPREGRQDKFPAISGIEPLYPSADHRPVLVGERTNVIGSRKFREMIAAGQYEDASEIARRQVKRGAQVIDICLADPDRNEAEDMERFMQFVVNKVKVPLMIDSTDAQVIERALKYVQGKAIINSINLEDGEDRFREVVPLIHRYGAAVVVGTIDEEGMAVTADKKLKVAQRSYTLLTEQYGIPPEDIIFDPLVFPVGTGDLAYIGSAAETVEGIRRIKKALPRCQTVLGVSNVSFGLPLAGREVLNAVYLYHCTRAGLDYAIVNTEKLERYASVPEEERKMAETFLFDTDEDHYDEVLQTFVQFYRGKKRQPSQLAETLTLEERLARYVVEGSKDGLISDLEEALSLYPPLEIINGPLMKGMDEVGRLFNDNQLIVAEVLQSAEVMKASVAFLEPYMEKQDTDSKGKVLLATVKGDVHDIGKNLVEIILSNNGYDVINLGIKVPPEQLIAACRREKPDVVGLSGLLVKSAQQMVLTAQDMKQAEIEVPILVGGAALTRKFTDHRIASQYNGPVLYAKDAMNGLDLANRLVDEDKRAELIAELRKNREEALKQGDKKREGKTDTEKVALGKKKKSSIRQDAPTYQPPDYQRHILRDYPVSHLLPYINEQMLFGKHMGLKGNVVKMIRDGEKKATALKEEMDALILDLTKNKQIRPDGVYRFFPAQSKGDSILVYDPDHPGKKVLETFTFPRQSKEPYLCLADFLRSVDSGVMDHVGFLLVTAGYGVRDLSERWKQSGDYLRSHMLQSLALELAEAFAERLHHVMRDVWGFPDPPEMTMRERLSARYQGVRVSFGYPACPDLEDQARLFRLIQPEEIGVQLTEGFMMEPEASVSAMVFSHPQGRYFNAE
ncbi:methionine synthase [Kroppenstedtia pulmonis]|uniref:Methionine synthase n=2 Tax=Kroppenstedtia pulmonis TaxID=1380685 RepID=A0A7D3XPZ3_9BACL|nr:methionine synthase [Kroppenstedtia pulmonis]QKG85849.1 methionine synthase [Kroppenstedtia pulmonis]